jgi:hypothetical protein
MVNAWQGRCGDLPRISKHRLDILPNLDVEIMKHPRSFLVEAIMSHLALAHATPETEPKGIPPLGNTRSGKNYG